MDIRSDRQKGLSYVELGRKYHMDPRTANHDVPYWTITSVEHNGKDYYLVGHKDIPMKGLRVRVRTQPWPWQ